MGEGAVRQAALVLPRSLPNAKTQNGAHLRSQGPGEATGLWRRRSGGGGGGGEAGGRGGGAGGRGARQVLAVVRSATVRAVSSNDLLIPSQGGVGHFRERLGVQVDNDHVQKKLLSTPRPQRR